VDRPKNYRADYYITLKDKLCMDIKYWSKKTWEAMLYSQ